MAVLAGSASDCSQTVTYFLFITLNFYYLYVIKTSSKMLILLISCNKIFNLAAQWMAALLYSGWCSHLKIAVIFLKIAFGKPISKLAVAVAVLFVKIQLRRRKVDYTWNYGQW